MASHGQDETARLKANLDDQLQRLLTQLDDLEELREELEDDEYEEVRVDTLEQLEELQVQMDNFSKGNATLVSQLGAMRLAIEATIKSEARTPEIIRMFAAKQAPSLRQRFRDLKEGAKLGRVS
ncbi:lzic, partial [Symbiodinium sp. KB8]